MPKKMDKKQKRNLTRLALGLLTASSILVGARLGFPAYERKRIIAEYKEAHKRTAEAYKQAGYGEIGASNDPRQMPFALLKNFVERRREVSESFEEKIPIIDSFVQENLASLDSLTSSTSEINGNLTMGQNGIEVKIWNHTNRYNQYIEEFIAGNYTHKDEVDLRIRRDPLFMQILKEKNAPPDAMSGLLNIMEAYDKEYLRLDETARAKVTGMYMEDTSGQVTVLPVERVRELYEAGLDMLKIAASQKTMSMNVISTNTFDDPGFIARFHTHPFEDPNYMPSDSDCFNTFSMGPNVLFSQKDDTLHVSAISDGKYREIVSAPLHQE